MKRLMSIFLLLCICLTSFVAKSDDDISEYCTPDGDCIITEAPEGAINSQPEERTYSEKFADQALNIDKAMALSRNESGFSDCVLADDQTIQCYKKNKSVFFTFKQVFNDKAEELEYYEKELDKELDELEKSIEEE